MAPTELFADAVACWESDRSREAETLCRAAVEADPTYTEAHRLLLVILAASGQLVGAIAAGERVAELAPQDAANLRRLAELWRRAGKPDLAVPLLERALRLEPGNSRTMSNLGHVLNAMGRTQEAIAILQRAIEVDSPEPIAFHNLGNALSQAGRMDEAIAVYERALSLQDRFPELLQALSLQPTLARAHARRGISLLASGRDGEAISDLARATQLDPQGATSVFLHAAQQMMQLGRPESAHAAFSKLLELQPDQLVALEGRVIALIALGRHEDALPELAALRSAAPSTDYLAGIYFHVQLRCCDWTDFDSSSWLLAERVRRAERADVPLTFITHNASPAEQRRCAEIYVADKCLPDAAVVGRPPRPAKATLRIGYLSGDLRDHAVAQLLVGVLESHDRARFETFAFSTGPHDASELGRRIKASFDHFLEVAALTDLQIAARMAELSIDIVIDLGGHSAGGRTRVLAYRPGPVQVSFLGFPGTLGADFVDYIIADPHVIPESERAHYSEQVAYLPDTCLPTDGAAPLVAPATRIDAGLPANGFVYCCFNATHKISPAVFEVWMRLLTAVPDSVLWLRDASALVKSNLAKEATQRGVDSSRLIHALRMETRAEHYARFALADLFLDTRPYNAHTTASEALGVGVPVITARDRTFASRVASSLLEACGLGHLAVDTLEDYERVALELARNPDAAADLKTHLRRVRTNAPLFDPKRFCRHLEAAYTEMWGRHLRGQLPATLWIERSP